MSLYLRQAPLLPITCLSNMVGTLAFSQESPPPVSKDAGSSRLSGAAVGLAPLATQWRSAGWVRTGPCAGLLPTTLLCHTHPVLAGVWFRVIHTLPPYLAGALVPYLTHPASLPSCFSQVLGKDSSSWLRSSASHQQTSSSPATAAVF